MSDPFSNVSGIDTREPKESGLNIPQSSLNEYLLGNRPKVCVPWVL